MERTQGLLHVHAENAQGLREGARVRERQGARGVCRPGQGHLFMGR